MFLKRLSTLLICMQVCVGMVMGANTDSQTTNLSLEKANLLAPNALTFDPIPVSPTCNDGNNGYFIIKNVTPSVPSYRYKIINASNVEVQPLTLITLVAGQYQTPQTLRAGTYTIILEYTENSVTETRSINRTIINPDKIVITYDQANSSFPTCPGETASLAFTAQGGTGALSYELSNNGTALPSQLTGTFTNLPTGNYTLKVSDATNNCWAIYDQPLVVQQLNDFTLSSTPIKEITCEGELATVKINGLPTEPYTIQFKKDGTTIGIPSQNAFGFSLAAGSYDVSVFRNSCPTGIKNVAFTVDGFGPVTVDYGLTVFPHTLNCTDDALELDVTLNGGNANRQATVRIQNSQGTYDESITMAYGSTFPFTNIPAGDYTLTWTDALNTTCRDARNFKVNGPASPIAYSSQPYAVKEFICSATATGQIRIPVTGGNGTYTYYYKLVSAASFSTNLTNTVSGLSEGVYVVYAEDSNGCSTQEINVEIKSFPAITVNLAPTAPVLCETSTDGSVSATIQGGSGSYVYSITGPTTKTGDVTGSLSVSGLAVGSYSIAISDKECAALLFNDVFEIEATYNLVVFVSESKTPVTCDNTGGAYEIVATDNTGNLLTYTLTNLTTGVAAPPKQGSAGVTFTDLTNGLYSVSVTNGGSCNILERPVSIAEYKSFTIQGIPTQPITVDCFGEEGVLPLTVQGGNGPFQYRVDADVWSSDFPDIFTVDNGLTSSVAGVEHLVEVQDVNGCVKNFKVLVKSPSLLDYSTPVVQDLSCKGNATGIVTVEVTGGSPIYSATMNGNVKSGSSSIVFDKLSAGAYNITIVDSKGCDLGTAIPILVNEPAEDFSLTTPIFEEIKCFQGTTTVEVSTTGGWGTDVTYNLKGGGKDVTVPNGKFTEVKAGNYTLTATNADGCTNSTTFVVDEPTRLIMTYLGKFDISCKDRSDGKIVVKAEGGTAPYFHGLEGVNSSFNSFVLSPVDTVKNLAQGAYNLIVQDANGCQSSIVPVEIVEPNPIVASVVSFTDVECYGLNNGKIVLTAVGGIGTKEYTIVAGSVPARSNNTGVFENLPPADYQISVRDANLCSNPVPVSQVIGEPKEIFVTDVNPIDVKCFNGANGAIEITASGGQPFDGLRYSIKDYPLAPQASNKIEGLKKGIYTVVVTDSRGKCAKETTNVLVNSPDQLEFVNKLFTDVTCHNAEDGTIERTVRGGTPNFSYNLYNENDAFISSTDGKFSGLGQQNKAESYYKIVVIDGNDCKIEDNVKIINPPAIMVEPIVIEPVRCFGENNGSIHIKAIGGTGELKYSLDGGVTFNNATDPLFASVPGKYIKLAPKFYTPWVTDKNNCTPGNYPTKVQVEVIQPDELTATYVLDSISCFDTKDAEITITAEGGNDDKPYDYSVDNKATWQSDNNFKNVISGLYKLVVKDWKGCELIFNDLDVVNPARIDLLIDSTAVTCFDDNDATLRFRATGGVGPFTVSTKPLFDAGSTETYPGSKLDKKYEDLEAGVEYIYYIRDKEKCPVNTINGQNVKLKTSDPVLKHTFFNPPQLVVFAVDTMPERCAGEKGGSITIHARGGVGPLEFNVQSAKVTTPYHSTWAVKDSVITRLVADNYYVLVRDAHGCKPVDTDFTPKTWTVRAQNRTEMVISVWDSEDANCPLSQDGWVKLGVRNTFENTFSWTITAESEYDPYKLGSSLNDSTVLIEELPAQNYIFEVTDLASLCTADTVITVPYLYLECEDLIIPTAFTPNGDGYNDTWRIENIELYSKMKIQIYTVSGEKVLDVDGPFEGEWGWNGQLNNDGRYLPSGTYIVMIWRDFDLVGKVKPKETVTVDNTNTPDGNTTPVVSSTANAVKTKKGKPDYIGNVTILRNF